MSQTTSPKSPLFEMASGIVNAQAALVRGLSAEPDRHDTAPRFLLNPAIVRIRRRLERWELDHLRQHVAEQAERIEELERELRWAEQSADMWQCSAEAMQEHLDDSARIGITVDGRVGTVCDEQVWSPS